MSGVTTKDVGSNIRAERVRLGLTQKELADLVDINLVTLVSYENDASSIKASLLLKFAEVLKCNVSDFFIHR